MKKFAGILYVPFFAVLAACDLQPKIVSLPDSVGEFISARYPALLADPESQPEIYNSAATDYGVYASPQLYGTPSDDYVVYASADDYTLPEQRDVATSQNADASTNDDASDAEETDDYLVVPMYGGGARENIPDDSEIIVARGDTLYSLARRHGMTVSELARINNMSDTDTLRVGQRLRIRGADAQTNIVSLPASAQPVSKPVTPSDKSETRVPLQNITVAPGDTLYSLSRKYSVPVNDLAVMNNLSAPFTLSVGQTLRVPNLTSIANDNTPKPGAAKTAKGAAHLPATNANVVQNTKPATAKTTPKSPTSESAVASVAPAAPKKISSDPSKKLPSIGARSSSKFSWPVRGKILSNYGAKPNGLVNDGINIGAARGTRVNAAENGVVAYAGNEVKGMGNLVIIQHSDGWMTVYAHMDSMAVRRGARVNVGGKIGTVGATGKVDKPQLHFEIRKGTRAYNPTQYLKK